MEEIELTELIKLYSEVRLNSLYNEESQEKIDEIEKRLENHPDKKSVLKIISKLMESLNDFINILQEKSATHPTLKIKKKYISKRKMLREVTEYMEKILYKPAFTPEILGWLPTANNEDDEIGMEKLIEILQLEIDGLNDLKDINYISLQKHFENMKIKFEV